MVELPRIELGSVIIFVSVLRAQSSLPLRFTFPEDGVWLLGTVSLIVLFHSCGPGRTVTRLVRR